MGAQPRGVFSFFQVVHFHSWIAASSRSRVRRSDFCGLHPRTYMSLPAWVKWYRIPNLRSISVGILHVVQISVFQPNSSCPIRR